MRTIGLKVLLTAAAVGLATIAWSAEIKEPGGDGASARLALTDPDEYAWRLFLYLNHPAKPGAAGVADETRPFGDHPESGAVVWETWALESGGDHSEVYKPDGSKPIAWQDLNRAQRRLILEPNLERIAVRSSSTLLKPRFDELGPDDQEVRANESMLKFITENEMYNLDGLEKLLETARDTGNRNTIIFPVGAKEIKAQWYPIREEDKPRYFWRDVHVGETKQPYGLVAFHVITKDLPNWFWADFGHIDCESARGACDNDWLRKALGPKYVIPQEIALTEPVDKTTRGENPPSGADGIRKETVGTIWENYILRGSQIDFVKSFGENTILSNPVIENTFQQSSCITCHARASIGLPFRAPDGTLSPNPNTLSPGDPELGSPNQTLFGAGPGFRSPSMQYLQTDFIWSAPFRAKRKK